MARSQNKYADFEGLRERAVALRRAGYSLRQIRDELKVFNNDILSQLVKGNRRRSGRSAPERRTTCAPRPGSYASKAGRTTRSRPSWAGLLQEFGVAVGA